MRDSDEKGHEEDEISLHFEVSNFDLLRGRNIHPAEQSFRTSNRQIIFMSITSSSAKTFTIISRTMAVVEDWTLWTPRDVALWLTEILHIPGHIVSKFKNVDGPTLGSFSLDDLEHRMQVGDELIRKTIWKGMQRIKREWEKGGDGGVEHGDEEDISGDTEMEGRMRRIHLERGVGGGVVIADGSAYTEVGVFGGRGWRHSDRGLVHTEFSGIFLRLWHPNLEFDFVPTFFQSQRHSSGLGSGVGKFAVAKLHL